MKLKPLALAGLCGALAVTLPSPAAAQGGPARAQVVTIQVCNNTTDNARVALSYKPVGQSQFYNEGWFGVPAHSCQNLVDTENGYAYAYAEVENEGARYWSGDAGQCVTFPGPYAFWSANAPYCADGQELKQFVTLHTTAFGVFTWNLNPVAATAPRDGDR